MRLIAEGINPGETEVEFFQLEISNILKIGEGRYTTMIEQEYDGAWHAVSLDYGQDFLEFFCVMANGVDREEVEQHFAKSPMPFLLPSPLKLDHLGARLGLGMKNACEAFAPFQVTRAKSVWGEALGPYPEPELDAQDSP